MSDGRVRGVVSWNVWGRLDAARALIAEPGPFNAKNVKGKIQSLGKEYGGGANALAAVFFCCLFGLEIISCCHEHLTFNLEPVTPGSPHATHSPSFLCRLNAAESAGMPCGYPGSGRTASPLFPRAIRYRFSVLPPLSHSLQRDTLVICQVRQCAHSPSSLQYRKLPARRIYTYRLVPFRHKVQQTNAVTCPGPLLMTVSETTKSFADAPLRTLWFRLTFAP